MKSKKLIPLAGTHNYADLLKQFSVLDKESWPVELNPGYGADEVKDMCKRFELPKPLVNCR